jgi:sialate O-acetylesterase
MVLPSRQWCCCVILTSLVAVLLSTVVAAAPIPTLKLPTVLASNMVIQRANKPGLQSSLWGWSNFSTSVSVKLDGKLLGQAIPNASDGGRWTFALPIDAHKEASSGPHTIEISAGASAKQTLINIAFGDIFFCSGREYSWLKRSHPPSFVSLLL